VKALADERFGALSCATLREDASGNDATADLT
jgi:hypothetical protein